MPRREKRRAKAQAEENAEKIEFLVLALDYFISSQKDGDPACCVTDKLVQDYAHVFHNKTLTTKGDNNGKEDQ